MVPSGSSLSDPGPLAAPDPAALLQGQRPADLDLLIGKLQQRAGAIGIVAKIETVHALYNLPELISRAAGRQPFGVMIARGDPAVEISFPRLAEIQEEILWVCEAAHVPVIWATQVLENLAQKGIPSRAHITDAAMAERAECVMLNKGPYVAEAVRLRDDVLRPMEPHQRKKTSQLRALRLW
jgi:pyruvate kinase